MRKTLSALALATAAVIPFATPAHATVSSSVWVADNLYDTKLVNPANEAEWNPYGGTAQNFTDLTEVGWHRVSTATGDTLRLIAKPFKVLPSTATNQQIVIAQANTNVGPSFYVWAANTALRPQLKVGGTQVPCPEATSVYNPSAGTITIDVPYSCMGATPNWQFSNLRTEARTKTTSTGLINYTDSTPAMTTRSVG